MPELPDVEGFRRLFAEQITGRRVERTRVPDPDVLRNTSPQGLGRALRHRRFAPPARHGKWLFTPTRDGATAVWHFGMTGSLRWTADEPLHRHDRLVLRLDGGELRLRMMRKLGGVWLVAQGGDPGEVTGPLGPDALTISAADLREALTGRGVLKSALMDQERVAGPGNLVVDEVCWRARVHPRRRLASLTDDDHARVHGALRGVLADAVPTGRVPPREDWLTGARDEDHPTCPRCGAALEHGAVAGRSTWWCAAEQRLD